MRKQGTAKHMVTPRVLVFPERDGYRLLLEGGPKKWFAGRLNGLGGSVQPGENVLGAAQREVLEECGVAPTSLELAAIVHVTAEPPVMLFVYSATLPAGDVFESPEGKLVWLTPKEIQESETPLLPDVRGYLACLDARGPGDPPVSLAITW